MCLKVWNAMWNFVRNFYRHGRPDRPSPATPSVIPGPDRGSPSAHATSRLRPAISSSFPALSASFPASTGHLISASRPRHPRLRPGISLTQTLGHAEMQCARCVPFQCALRSLRLTLRARKTQIYALYRLFVCLKVCNAMWNFVRNF